MDVASLKEYIYNEDLVETVLENLDCHHIKRHSNEYITCGNPDGDNASAIVVYLTENLNTIDYTRCLSKTKKSTDLIDLVMFLKDITFPQAMKYLCETLGLDYYSKDWDDIPESLQIIQMLKSMNSGASVEDSKPLKPLNKKILSYYLPYGNKMFESSGIPLDIQREFSIGYDCCTNRITIPLFDITGELVGVKGRLFKDNITENDPPKYVFICPCNKSKLLYGYFENQKYIKNSSCVYVCESEKAVQQLASVGIRNCVATGGKTISKYQIEMLTRMNVEIVLAFDQDVTKEELQDIANMFLDGVPVYAMIDKEHLMADKMSPTDDMDIFYKLKDNLIKLK